MAFFESFLTIYILLILFFSVLRPQVAVGLYLPYLILIPFLNIDAGGISVQYNLVNIVLLLGFLLNNRKKYIYWKPFIPFLFFYLAQLAVFPFQELSTSYMFNTWRIEAMKYLILPFVMYNLVMDNNTLIKVYRKILIISVIIAGVYGLYLTRMPGSNPYMMYMFANNGSEFNEAYALGFGGLADSIDYKTDSGRLFGRISSVFRHPMTFGLFISFSIVYLLGTFRKQKPAVAFLVFLILGINAITCGVRSTIAALAITITFLLIRLRNARLMLITVFTVVVGFFILEYFFPNLSYYLLSMTDTEGTEMGGSSIALRLEQLQGCFEEIKNNMIFGKGFGWTQFYMSVNETHPVILAFESLVFVALCNEGLIFGSFLWLCFFILVSKAINRMKKRNHKTILLGLFLAYISFATITGDYGYMQYFIMFFIMLYAEYRIDESEAFRKKSTNSQQKKKSRLKKVLTLNF